MTGSFRNKRAGAFRRRCAISGQLSRARGNSSFHFVLQPRACTPHNTYRYLYGGDAVIASSSLHPNVRLGVPVCVQSAADGFS